MTQRFTEDCAACGRRFSGRDTFRRHAPLGRCLKTRELAKRGVVKNAEGIFYRPKPSQLTLAVLPLGRPRAIPESTLAAADCSPIDQGGDGAA